MVEIVENNNLKPQFKSLKSIYEYIILNNLHTTEDLKKLTIKYDELSYKYDELSYKLYNLELINNKLNKNLQYILNILFIVCIINIGLLISFCIYL